LRHHTGLVGRDDMAVAAPLPGKLRALFRVGAGIAGGAARKKNTDQHGPGSFCSIG
jgi:hypothetical protein